MARRRRESWWESALVLGALLVAGAALGAKRMSAKPLTFAELRTLAEQAGFPPEQLDTMAAIALAESGGDPGAIPQSGERSYGLWQIHTPDWPEFDAARLREPLYNAQAALKVFRSVLGLTAWSTYNNGRYKQYLPGAK